MRRKFDLEAEFKKMDRAVKQNIEKNAEIAHLERRQMVLEAKQKLGITKG